MRHSVGLWPSRTGAAGMQRSSFEQPSLHRWRFGLPPSSFAATGNPPVSYGYRVPDSLSMGIPQGCLIEVRCCSWLAMLEHRRSRQEDVGWLGSKS